MRIAIIAETFLPSINGVTNSVLQVLRHLAERGDEVLVIAPSTSAFEDASFVEGAFVLRLPSVPLAGYESIRVVMGSRAKLKRILAGFAPDVVHLASPFELGWRAARAADRLGIPTVAIYQTDLPGYAAKYGLPLLERWASQRVAMIHQLAGRTLVPSSAAEAQLAALDVPRLHRWGRGVDTERFHPGRRDRVFRDSVAPGARTIVGYVGRLAAEKQVQDLRALRDLPGTRVVVVGDGPERGALERAMPDVFFTGSLTGDRLAAAMASFDLFVHPGELETFGQTIQEAMASGVPVVAPAAGGPLDLVDPSRTGWLYPPGDLTALRGHVVDLLGDDAKRAAFALAARESVQRKTWPALCAVLVEHYEATIRELVVDAR